MAKKSTPAQHFLQCDNCDENPAKFLCKICPGHLCSACKCEHERKKMTRTHDIVSLTSNNEEMLDLLYCPDHLKKKVECYCNSCERPVCTECILDSHNGHSVQALSKVYRNIAENLRQQTNEIENNILPKYRGLLDKEIAKKSTLAERADDIEMKIGTQTERVIEIVRKISEQKVRDLREEEKKGHQNIDELKGKIEKKINELEEINKAVSANLNGRPDISFFEPRNCDEFENIRMFSSTSEASKHYLLTDFEPGDLDTVLQERFGISPKLQTTVCIMKKVNDKPCLYA